MPTARLKHSQQNNKSLQIYHGRNDDREEVYSQWGETQIHNLLSIQYAMALA